MRDLVHLQAGIVRMADHDLGFARAACSGLSPGVANCLNRIWPSLPFASSSILGGRSRATAGGLHVGLHHIELPSLNSATA